MKRYRTKEKDTFYEETGQIKVRNYPPSSDMTYPYVTRCYRKYKKNMVGWVEVDGYPIYFHELNPELLSLAIIAGVTNNILHDRLKREDGFIEVKSDNPFRNEIT